MPIQAIPRYSKRFGRSLKALNSKLLHEQFKQSLIKEKRWIRFFQLLILVSFICVWELASKLKWIDQLIFSSPSKIWVLFIEKLNDGTLLPHISTTMFETVLGFIIGTLIGTILAAFFGGLLCCQRC